MQQSMFNLRVPLPERGEVFLMNTLTDAQLIVSDGDRRAARSSCRTIPASLAPERLDSDDARSAGDADRARVHRAEPRDRHRGAEQVLHGLPRRHRADARDGADDAAVQLRVRLLLPGRPRRLQQARRSDVARRQRAAGGVDRAAPRRAEAEAADAHVLRRRAAAQYAGRVRPGRAGVRGVPEARRHARARHHHQRAAAHRRARRSAAALRPRLREGDARRRPRHAQQDASAPRRPGHVRPDHRERPQGRRQGAHCGRRQLRRRFGRRAIPRCSIFSRSRTSPTSWRRWRSSPSCASGRRRRTSFRSPSSPTSR